MTTDEYDRLSLLLLQRDEANLNVIREITHQLELRIAENGELLRKETRDEVDKLRESMNFMSIQIDRNSRIDAKVYLVCTVIFSAIATVATYFADYIIK